MPINEPIHEKIANQLRPQIMKLLADLNVKYAEYRNSEVRFHFLDMEVTIQVKSKIKK